LLSNEKKKKGRRRYKGEALPPLIGKREKKAPLGENVRKTFLPWKRGRKEKKRTYVGQEGREEENSRRGRIFVFIHGGREKKKKGKVLCPSASPKKGEEPEEKRSRAFCQISKKKRGKREKSC